MKRGGIVEAVTKAVAYGSDCWEARYYCDDNFNPRKRETYMYTRRIALGPEWHESQRCTMMMRGELPRVYIHHDVIAQCHELIKRDRPLSEAARARAEQRLADYNQQQPIDNGHAYREVARDVSVTK